MNNKEDNDDVEINDYNRASFEKNICYLDNDYDDRTIHSTEILPAMFITNGAWKYLVIIGSFLAVAIVDGISYTYGLHIIEIIDQQVDFKTNMRLEYLFLPGSLLFGICFISTPFVFAMMNCFELRTMGMFGSVMGGVFVCLSSYSQSITTFTALFGVGGGIVCGLLYLSAISVLNNWFTESPGNVVGICLCGTGFGTIVLALTIPLISHYLTWRCCIIIIAGIILQGAVCFALFRPLNVQQKIQVFATESRSDGKLNANGTILTRILNQKKRLRATSTGSLDGIMITRENEMVHLPNETDYNAVRQAAMDYLKKCSIDHEDNDKSNLLLNQENLQTPEGIADRAPSEKTRISSDQIKMISRQILRQLESDKSLRKYFILYGSSLNTSQVINDRDETSTSHRNINHNRVDNSSSQTNFVQINAKSSPDLDLIIRRKSGFEAFSQHDSCIQQKMQHKLDLYSKIIEKQHDFKKIVNKKVAKLNYPEDVKTEIKNNINEEFLHSLSKSSNILKSDVPIDPKLLSDLTLNNTDITSRSLENLVKLKILRNNSSNAISLMDTASIHSNLTNHSRLKVLEKVPEVATIDHRNSQTSNSYSLNQKNNSKLQVNNDSVTFQLGMQSVDNSKLSIQQSLMRKVSQPVDQRSSQYQEPHEKRVSVKHFDRFVYRSRKQRFLDFLCYQSEYFDVPLLFDLTFILLIIASLINAFVTIMPYYYLPLLLYLDEKIEFQSKSFVKMLKPEYAISLAGFSNIIGRLFGTIYIRRGLEVQKIEIESDKKTHSTCRLGNCIILNVLLSLLLSISLLLMPWAVRGTNHFVDPSTPSLTLVPHNQTSGSIGAERDYMLDKTRLGVFYCGIIIFGLTSSIMISIRSVMLAELFGIIRITNSFGYMLVFQGIGVIMGFYLTSKMTHHMCGSIMGPQLHGNSIFSGYLDGGDCSIFVESAFYVTFFASILATTLFLLLKFTRKSTCCHRASGPVYEEDFNEPGAPR